jgi:hypothetical protein
VRGCHGGSGGEEERGENKEGECEESVEVHLKRTLNLLGGCSDLEVLGIGRAG